MVTNRLHRVPSEKRRSGVDDGPRIFDEVDEGVFTASFGFKFGNPGQRLDKSGPALRISFRDVLDSHAAGGPSILFIDPYHAWPSAVIKLASRLSMDLRTLTPSCPI